MSRAILAAAVAVLGAIAFADAQQPTPTPRGDPRGQTQGESPIPAPQATQCQNFVATNAAGVVQHYEDCTPADGLVKRCEVIDATDARGKVRKIQNCARVTAPEGTGPPR